MKRRVLVVLSLAVALTGLWATAALAEDTTKPVGLVIAFPDGTKVAQIVTVPADATAYDALKKANIALIGTTGQFGLSVCSINQVGCAASNCFCDSKHFWAFYNLDPQTNQWVASSEGVGAVKPASGAVVGFVWSGVDDKFNPTDQPPVMTFQQIQAQSGSTSGQAAQPAALPVTGVTYQPYLLAVAAALLLIGLSLNSRGRSA